MAQKATRPIELSGGMGDEKLSPTAQLSKLSRDAFEESIYAVNTDITRRDFARKRLASVYQSEPKRVVMIAPTYEAYFGARMHVSINGISISVPCDGRPYEIPDSFAAMVQFRLRGVNDQLTKQKRFSSVSTNSETSPGELPLF